MPVTHICVASRGKEGIINTCILLNSQYMLVLISRHYYHFADYKANFCLAFLWLATGLFQ